MNPVALCSELEIKGEADVALARYRAGAAATEQGFSEQRRAEIRLITTELARNHLDHKTVGGMIRISGQLVGQVPLLTIASLDQGPGIANVQEALHGVVGGYRSMTGLGTGLASVVRMADRFSCCSAADAGYRCLAGPLADWQGTVIAAQCWPGEKAPFYCTRSDMDIAALVCGRSESHPCGDGIFIHSDNRYTRMVMTDSPGKGRGGGQRELIGSMLAGLDVVWPPEQVVEALSEVIDAEPATELVILQLDRLQAELHCSRVGAMRLQMLIDGELVPAPLIRGKGNLRRTAGGTYRIGEQIGCLLHTDGVTGVDGQQAKALLARLLPGAAAVQSNPAGNPALLVQILFSRNRQAHDDAALCVWAWKRQ